MSKKQCPTLLGLKVGQKVNCVLSRTNLGLTATVKAVGETRATLEWFDGSESELSIFSDVERNGDKLVFNG